MRRHRLVARSLPDAEVFVPSPGVKAVPKADSYPGVSISLCFEPCACAVKQQGRRYLVDKVPELPLSGCDAARCHCRYRHHDDRRKDEDRRLGFGQFSDINPRLGKHERRSGGDEDRRSGKVSVESNEPSAYFNNY